MIKATFTKYTKDSVIIESRYKQTNAYILYISNIKYKAKGIHTQINSANNLKQAILKV